MSANSRQVGGTHYKTGGIEHWDLISRHDVGYLEGNATKYVSRSRNKNGLQDLRKAEHYVDKLIELAREGEISVPPRGYVSDEAIREFAGFQNLTNDEVSFVRMLCQWQSVMELAVAQQLLKQIISSYPTGEPVLMSVRNPCAGVTVVRRSSEATILSDKEIGELQKVGSGEKTIADGWPGDPKLPPHHGQFNCGGQYIGLSRGDDGPDYSRAQEDGE